MVVELGMSQKFFKTAVPRGRGGRKWQKTGANCLTRSFIIVIVHQYL
jgi:hypothetical protein